MPFWLLSMQTQRTLDVGSKVQFGQFDSRNTTIDCRLMSLTVMLRSYTITDRVLCCSHNNCVCCHGGGIELTDASQGKRPADSGFRCVFALRVNGALCALETAWMPIGAALPFPSISLEESVEPSLAKLDGIPVNRRVGKPTCGWALRSVFLEPYSEPYDDFRATVTPVTATGLGTSEPWPTLVALPSRDVCMFGDCGSGCPATNAE